MNPNYRSFVEAREFVRSLKFKTAAEYRKWTIDKLAHLSSKPRDIPSNPHQVYGDCFQGYADFLGSGNQAPYLRNFLPFEDARLFVRTLGLESSREWSLYAAGKIPSLGIRPDNIPSNPNFTYQELGWKGMRDWLGVGSRNGPGESIMFPFKDAREFARNLHLASWLEWRKYISGDLRHLTPKPLDIPAVPHACYRRRGWISYPDFLGTETIAWHSSEWRPFEMAREIVRSIGLRGQAEWRTWYREHGSKDIPFNPDKAYKEWKGWRDWLGTGRIQEGSSVTARAWIDARLRK